MNYRTLWQQLTLLYDAREAQAVARLVLDTVCHLSFADICAGKDTQLPAEEQAQLAKIAQRLSLGEPVQYVLGEAWFCGRRFSVNSDVLIPRPETEEMCRLIVADRSVNSNAEVHESEQHGSSGCRVLDIGTGSGCLAVTLALVWPAAVVEGWDISGAALSVAADNAALHRADVLWRQADILTAEPVAETWDMIVSNPPYIPARECREMERRVTDYEPSVALFVPDDDPLRFYRAIGSYALASLVPDGVVWLETHYRHADAVQKLLLRQGFGRVSVLCDAFGKQRFVRAQRQDI